MKLDWWPRILSQKGLKTCPIMTPPTRNPKLKKNLQSEQENFLNL